MDIKKWAVVLAILILVPLFLGLFVDAIHVEPKYEKYCHTNNYATPIVAGPVKPNVTCPNYYNTPEAQACVNDQGMVREKYDSNNCPLYDSCDYCQRDLHDAQQKYNRNIFFILAPIGLIIIIIGLYLAVDYIGAGLMFGGIITLFYATFRYFSDMDKLVRAFVILIELLIIIWIAYKKIERNNEGKALAKKSSKKIRRK